MVLSAVACTVTTLPRIDVVDPLTVALIVLERVLVATAAARVTVAPFARVPVTFAATTVAVIPPVCAAVMATAAVQVPALLPAQMVESVTCASTEEPIELRVTAPPSPIVTPVSLFAGTETPTVAPTPMAEIDGSDSALTVTVPPAATVERSTAARTRSPPLRPMAFTDTAAPIEAVSVSCVPRASAKVTP